jgi:hypothetical protein
VLKHAFVRSKLKLNADIEYLNHRDVKPTMLIKKYISDLSQHRLFKVEKMAEKPTAAFVLSLIGGIFVIIGGLVTAAIAAIVGSAFDIIGMGSYGLGFALLGALGLVWGIIILLGAVMMNSTDKSRVRTGSIIVLVFSIISWFGSFGGFFLGFLLALIGSILGLTWNPSKSEAAPPPPP